MEKKALNNINNVINYKFKRIQIKQHDKLDKKIFNYYFF